jgi:hypothetical protein
MIYHIYNKMNFHNGYVLIPELRGDKQVLIKKQDGTVYPLNQDQTIAATYLNELPENIKYKNWIKNAINDNTALKGRGSPCKKCNVTIYTIVRLGPSEETHVLCNGCNTERSM